MSDHGDSSSSCVVPSPLWSSQGSESPDFGAVNPDDLFPPLQDPPLYAESDAPTVTAQRDARSPRPRKEFGFMFDNKIQMSSFRL